ncbi:MAG: hypothetical protein CBE00_04440 [Planctomycetaceae bacterium TMED240]|nr:hypothetical protein [Rhodopirellula sp.]OUX07482.1 MAG: hypothetical protein CBE00_04440 [Planctomycetaceae bacterium TMED240]
MGEILLNYERPQPATWVYLSSFLTIGLYFVFHRFWSIRNLDLVLLILLAPGLLVVYEGRQLEQEERANRSQQIALQSGTQTKSLVEKFLTLVQPLPMYALSPRGSVQSESVANSLTVLQKTPSFVSEEVSGTTTELVEANSGIPPEAIEGGPAELDSPVDEDFTSDELQRIGFLYLLTIQAFILVRMMLDPIMSRRPLLDPNLTAGGLMFLGVSLFVFMMANVVRSDPQTQYTQGPELGPGYALMRMLPSIPTLPINNQLEGLPADIRPEPTAGEKQLAVVAKVLAILAHLGIVSAIILISNRHFGNTRAGVGCATLYLILPYTAQMTGRVDHALPAAFLLWAILTYRRPLIAGMFVGLAGGLVYYPLFLLPLWISFYWKRGVRKFILGTACMLALLMLALWFDDSSTLADHLQHMYGVLSPLRDAETLQGLWALGWNPFWRLPVIVAYVILSAFFAIWPAQKNLGTILSGSAALMIAAQFWHGESGGLYIAWFLPLLLLTIFRPNLQDRIATKVVAGPNLVRGSKTELETV